KVVRTGGGKAQVLDTGAADVVQKDLQRRRDIFGFTPARKVTMTCLCELLDQRAIRIAAESERKNANVSFDRLNNLLEIARAGSRICVRDQHEAVFAGRKLRRQ